MDVRKFLGKNHEPLEEVKEVKEVKESQSHGFEWEKDILKNVYKVTEEELSTISYTNKHDLPENYNKLYNINLSVKTTGSKTVYMGSAVRVFNGLEDRCHLVVITYKQIGNIKKVKNIVEMNITDGRKLLFGELSLQELLTLDKIIKKVPRKRKPSETEKKKIYQIKMQFQKKLSRYIVLNPKIDNSQSRLQCSFRDFPRFVSENKNRIVAMSETNEFRGGFIKNKIKSNRRTRNPRI